MKWIDVSTKKNENTRTIIDDEDHHIMNGYKWHVDTGGYVVRKQWVNGKKVIFSLHREIMKCPDGMFVDHINHDLLDNRKENLRIVTNNQNQQNRRPNKGRDYKGVFKNSRVDRYEARIGHEGRNYYLGIYPTPEMAARAYDIAAKVLFGAYAYLNFPDDTLKISDLVKLWHEVNC